MEIEEIKEILTHTEQVPDIVKLEENDNQPQVQVQPKNKKIKISAFKCNSCGKKFSAIWDYIFNYMGLLVPVLVLGIISNLGDYLKSGLIMKIPKKLVSN